jgi:predicted DNA-binding transcriptional regulator AlpA
VARPEVTGKKHHLDRRADRIAAEGEDGNGDDLLSSRQVADWLGVTQEWVELGRSKNYGPRFTRLSPKVIRYRRADVLKWLRARSHASTSEYGA